MSRYINLHGMRGSTPAQRHREIRCPTVTCSTPAFDGGAVQIATAMGVNAAMVAE